MRNLPLENPGLSCLGCRHLYKAAPRGSVDAIKGDPGTYVCTRFRARTPATEIPRPIRDDCKDLSP